MSIVTGDRDAYIGELIRISLEALAGTGAIVFGLTSGVQSTLIQNGPILIGSALILDTVRSLIRTIKGRKMFLNGELKEDKKDEKKGKQAK